MDLKKRIKEAKPPTARVQLLLGLAKGEVCLDVPGPQGSCWLALHLDDTIEAVLRAFTEAQLAQAAGLSAVLEAALRPKQEK